MDRPGREPQGLLLEGRESRKTRIGHGVTLDHYRGRISPKIPCSNSDFGDDRRPGRARVRNPPRHVPDEIDREIIAACRRRPHDVVATRRAGRAVAIALQPTRSAPGGDRHHRELRRRDRSGPGRPARQRVASIGLERQREAELDRFAQTLADWPEVVDCYLMTGQRDDLMRMVVEDLEPDERILKEKLTRLDGVASIEPGIALGQPKRSNTLPSPGAFETSGPGARRTRR